MARKGKNKEIISTTSRLVRWFFSILLLIFTSITIFVLLSTLLNSFKTKTNILMIPLDGRRPFHWTVMWKYLRRTNLESTSSTASS